MVSKAKLQLFRNQLCAIGHSENKILTPPENEICPAVISTAILRNTFVAQSCRKASFATFRQQYRAACRSNLQFVQQIMTAITACRTSFPEFESDDKILILRMTCCLSLFLKPGQLWKQVFTLKWSFSIQSLEHTPTKAKLSGFSILGNFVSESPCLCHQ